MPNEIAQDSQDLDNYLSQICELNIENIPDILGIQKCEQGYRFDFFNRPILFDHNDFIDLSGKGLSPAVKTVLCKYITNCPQTPLETSGRLVTFREFPGAGPLFSRFVDNTNKTIENTFSKRLEEFKEKCKEMCGMPLSNASYDLNMRFKALPKIPVILQFNDVDEIFPAKAVFFFHDDAVQYLDLKSLAGIITYLTGLLINPLLIIR
jgi:hypothetical protein